MTNIQVSSYLSRKWWNSQIVLIPKILKTLETFTKNRAKHKFLNLIYQGRTFISISVCLLGYLFRTLTSYKLLNYDKQTKTKFSNMQK